MLARCNCQVALVSRALSEQDPPDRQHMVFLGASIMADIYEQQVRWRVVELWNCQGIERTRLRQIPDTGSHVRSTRRLVLDTLACFNRSVSCLLATRKTGRCMYVSNSTRMEQVQSRD